MHTPKWTVLLLVLCTLPLCAQQQKQQQKINAALQRAASQATTSLCTCNKNCDCQELTAQEKIAAETELQLIRDKRDSNASFDKYPYLLDPVYRRKGEAVCPCKNASTTSPASTNYAPVEDTDSLSVNEVLAAETELQYIRDTQDTQATFHTYTYLLDPAYRRADEAQQAQIRRQFHQQRQQKSRPSLPENKFQSSTCTRPPGWMRKVGL